MSAAALSVGNGIHEPTPNRCVLIVDDDADIRSSLQEILQDQGYLVLTAGDGEAALAVLNRDSVDLVVTDAQMQPMDGHVLLQNLRRQWPGIPVVMMSAHATIDNVVDAMKGEAAHYLVKPFRARQLLTLVDSLVRRGAAAGSLIAADSETLALKTLAERVAGSEATVMLSGPSGAGKEVFARFIHDNSPRAAQPFVALNCAAIPDTMLEAMLFGHEKGAFTGATGQHRGKFEQANGGTLLLDEVSEMDVGLQAKLLRVLQERELERIGSDKTLHVDVRIIATTNRDLKERVMQGEFREDLFYRLNVFPISIPPLAARPADILPLAEHLLERRFTGAGVVPMLDTAARRKLAAHGWPGNVRELDNVVQRALILCTGDRVTVDDIQFESAALPFFTTPVGEPVDEPADDLHEQLRCSERDAIEEAIQRTGSKKAAAEMLGISPRTLRYKLARFRGETITTVNEVSRHD